MDCYILKTKQINKKKVAVYPVFLHKPSRDIMVRDCKFYAVWNKDTGLWSTSRADVVEIIDREVEEAVSEMNKNSTEVHYVQCKMVSNDLSTYDSFIKWAKEEDDNFVMLNQKVIFANTKTKKTDYCSFKLPYNIEDGPREAYDEMISSLYDPEEREKIEWAIGSIITGEAKNIQKAIALYGAPGTGKSTVLDIITKMFKRDRTNTYTTTISTKALADKNNQFGTGPLRKYKLVLIDNDANLSKANENTILNQLISNDPMEANPKYGKTLDVEQTGMLFLATNKYINMSDAKSGLRRRIIIVKPKGNTIEYDHYVKLKRQINNEFGAIAYHCVEVFKKLGADAYNDYVPLDMFELSNPIYNWLFDTWDFELSKVYPDGISLDDAWKSFRRYCDDSGLMYGKKTEFKADMYEYFEVRQNANINGKRYRYFFTNIKPGLFEKDKVYKPEKIKSESWLDLKEQHSILDDYLKDCSAQYSNKHGTPSIAWNVNKTKLSDIDTSKEHYVMIPHQMIVIDFDTEGATKEDTLRVNKTLALEWPETYCEASRSGSKIHLHYIYDGDVEELKCGHIKDLEDAGYKVEVKVFNGNATLRRKLTVCNNVPFTHLSTGDLELKEKKAKRMYKQAFTTEDSLRKRIIRCLNKEQWSDTTQNVQLIKQILDDAYDSGKPYNVSDLQSAAVTFAGNATNNSEYCMKVVAGLHFKSENSSEEDFMLPNDEDYENAPIAFFDVEVFPNLFVLNWKLLDSESIVRMINPDPRDVWNLFCTNKYRWIGFYNRKYDNHIVKAWANGDRTNYDLFKMSQRIINEGDQNMYLADAWNLSYTDIWDYSFKKQSLKKWEIDLGIHHQELGLPWDQPVPEELWGKVAEYCDNDVIATEATFKATQSDYKARLILADLADGTPNQTTNQLTLKLVFGDEKNPQLIYTDLATGKQYPGR